MDKTRDAGWNAAADLGPPGALHAPATLRNRAPLLAVLRDVLPRHGVVLEVASGTGEHAAYFAAALAGDNGGPRWRPSDPDLTSPTHVPTGFAIRLLLSDAASYVTGATLTPDADFFTTT